MTRTALLILFALFFLHTRPLSAQEITSIDLRGIAAFHPGDDDTWRSKYIDEREGWNFIPVPGAWERNGFPLLDGFAWYRIRFRIPMELRDDSLLLIMSGVDDADETYLNGTGIGRLGAFPPQARSELHSLRIYALPKYLREEFNLLAIRVYDMGDSGGITGNIFRIIRADHIPTVLDEVVGEPFRQPLLYISNGAMASAFDQTSASIAWTKPHLFNELQAGLQTETVLSNVTLSAQNDGELKLLKDMQIRRTSYYNQTGVLQTQFDNGLDVYWFHPHQGNIRALVILATTKKSSPISDIGIRFNVEKEYWSIREIEQETEFEKRKYFLLVYNSCCDDLATRDMELLLSKQPGALEKFSLVHELDYWNSLSSEMYYFPTSFSIKERETYKLALLHLSNATVCEAGQGFGQIISSLQPPSRAYCSPRDHLLAAHAFAEAGLLEQAQAALRFIDHAEVGKYMFLRTTSETGGVGYPYLVTPCSYSGFGGETDVKNETTREFSFDGMALYVEAVEALRRNTKRKTQQSDVPFSDSAFLASRWPLLSSKVSDVLLFVQDSAGLLRNDAGPWGRHSVNAPNIYSSLHSASALFIASRYAAAMHDPVKEYLYNKAAMRSVDTIEEMITAAMRKDSSRSLTADELALFDPLLIDGIVLGLFQPQRSATQFALSVMEKSFAIDESRAMYNAQPDGDWFARQSRPFLTLRLARAYAVLGQGEKAEKLFQQVTDLAFEHHGMLPELVDPVSSNWYGGLPSIQSIAEYILTAEAIALLRENR